MLVIIFLSKDDQKDKTEPKNCWKYIEKKLKPEIIKLLNNGVKIK